jgi:putative transposase
VAKRHGVSEQTIHTWRKRFGTFQADDIRRLSRGMEAALTEAMGDRWP